LDLVKVVRLFLNMAIVTLQVPIRCLILNNKVPESKSQAPYTSLEVKSQHLGWYFIFTILTKRVFTPPGEMSMDGTDDTDICGAGLKLIAMEHIHFTH
jgi:hypothetical protein